MQHNSPALAQSAYDVLDDFWVIHRQGIRQSARKTVQAPPRLALTGRKIDPAGEAGYMCK